MFLATQAGGSVTGAQLSPEGSLRGLDIAEGRELAFTRSIVAEVSDPGAEHRPIATHGIVAEWSIGPIDSQTADLVIPFLDLRIVNYDEVDYLVSLRGHGDTGSRQTRFSGRGNETLLRAGAVRELSLHLDGRDLPLMTHSGSVRVSFDACPVDGGPCIAGATVPAYFHEEDGRLRVYGEALLCRSFGCGDLSRKAPAKRGTLRVMGGRPLLGEVAVDEEADEEPPAEGLHVKTAAAADLNDKAIVPIGLCVKLDVRTTDSGRTANGIREDYWAGANSSSSYIVTGRGFRVRVSWGSWARTLDTNPNTGCVSFASPLASATPLANASVRVYGYATDSAGNRVRIHNARTNTSSWYPGGTYSVLWTGQTLYPLKSHTYVVDGRADDRWTTIAAAAFGLYRYHHGNKGATISIGFDEGDCNDSGSIHGNAENYIKSNNAHLIRIGRCSGSASDAREKMLVTHELGHAMLRLYYGFDGDDAPRNDDYNPPSWVTTASPPQGSNCWNVSSYGMNSLEWNSQAFKEAFADFYSARVWNAKAARGTYTYRGIAYDLETWDNVGNTHVAGGFTENWCGVTSATGAISTKGDYLRFLWDFFTVTGCSSQPTELDMFKIYRKVRLNHLTWIFRLKNSNYDDALRFAIIFNVPGLSSCERAGFSAYADYNGI